jgi:hypothetical protein
MDLREIDLGGGGVELFRVGTGGGLLWTLWWTFGLWSDGVSLVLHSAVAASDSRGLSCVSVLFLCLRSCRMDSLTFPHFIDRYEMKPDPLSVLVWTPPQSTSKRGL